MVTERVRAIINELQKATELYRATKHQYEWAQVQFESAREQFAGVRKLATDSLTTFDWIDWRLQNPDVRYAGMPIGEAIQEVLRDHAYEQANLVVRGVEKRYMHLLPLEGIPARLEMGGYDFRTLTPAREVNAALIHLSGVQKYVNGYAIENHAEVLAEVKRWPASTWEPI